VRDTYGGQNVPVFLVGHSMGGTISLVMSALHREKFAGMTLLCPYLSLKDQYIVDAVMPVMRAANKVMPTRSFEPPKFLVKAFVLPHYRHFYDDPVYESSDKPHNFVVGATEMQKVRDVFLPKVDTPFLTILAENE
jgi:alpha-beta hydrolase superfamily lysophospholipase